ncbi:MAG: glycosyltransferase family 39 protein [Candidatus Gracilibacteria bacterium]|nr:glycosyltransferase family 39 protein [Candidatus Gracilibacteria bacterium]
MSTPKKSQPLALLLAGSWIVLVVWQYLAHHAYAKLGLFGSFALNIVLFWSILYFLVLSYRLLRNKSLAWSITLNPGLLVLGIFLFISLAGSFLLVRMGVLTLTSYWEMLISLTGKLFLSIFFVLALSLVSAALGKLVLMKFDFEHKLDGFLCALGVGLGLIALALFGLAFFGVYNTLGVSALFIVLTLLAHKQLWQLGKAVYTEQFEIRIDLGSFRILFYFIFLTLLSINALSILRVVPIGWDGLAGYVNTSHLLAGYGHLISGVNSYAYEIIMGLGFLFSSNAMLSIALASYASLLVFLLIYALVRKFSTHGFITALLFYALPLVIFHTQQESKIDLASLFFAGLVFLVLYYWIKERQTKFLYLAALIAGFSFSVKYTNIFLLAALIPTVAFVIYKQRLLSFRKALSTLLIFLVLGGLPFLPWAVFNSWTGEKFAPGIMQTGLYPGPIVNCELDTELVVNNTETTNLSHQSEAAKIDQVFNFSGFREEIGRYLGYTDGLKKYLLVPWTLTMNTNVQGLYVDIGFIFLALAPLALLLITRKKDLYTQALIVFTLTYWLGWLLLARGIIWYGLPGFVPFLLVIASLLQENTAHKLGSRFLGAVVLLSLLLGINAAILGFGHPADLMYLSGVSDQKTYVDNTMPSYRKIFEQVNQDDSYVYRIGTFIKYFISDNDRRVFSDDQMDALGCLLQKGSPEAVREKLKNEGFRYVILDLNIPSIDMTPEKSLTAKFNQTLYFLENYTTVITKETISRNKILFAEL